MREFDRVRAAIEEQLDEHVYHLAYQGKTGDERVYRARLHEPSGPIIVAYVSERSIRLYDAKKKRWRNPINVGSNTMLIGAGILIGVGLVVLYKTFSSDNERNCPPQNPNQEPGFVVQNPELLEV